MAEESSLPQQIRTVERSVVFLRQEHLTLLHGLHLEILSLQKRCSGEDNSAALVPVDLAPTGLPACESFSGTHQRNVF